MNDDVDDGFEEMSDDKESENIKSYTITKSKTKVRTHLVSLKYFKKNNFYPIFLVEKED